MDGQQTQHITKDMIISDILVKNSDKAAELAEVMMNFGIHCIGCGAAAFETLEDGVLGHGRTKEELDLLVRALNKIINSNNEETPKEIKEFKLDFTKKAIEKIKQAINQSGEDTNILRISVVGGGCSGFMYDMEVVKNSSQNDLSFKYEGINISVDKNSLEFLNGTRIDYIDTLKESGFKFNNPNAKKSCSCGKSFR